MISQSPEANLSFSSSVRREFAPQVDVLGGFLSVPEWMFFWSKGFFGVDPAKGPSKRTSPSLALPGFGPLGRWSRHTQHSKWAEKGQGLTRSGDVLAEARRSLGRILADASKTLGFNLGCQWLVTTGWHGIPNSRFICYWNPGPPSWFPRCLLFLTEIDLTIAQLLKWVDQPPSIRIQKIMLGKVMIFHVTEIFWFKNLGLSSRSRGCKGSDFCRWD